MKIRATAGATTRSNAVGTVELECTPQGLVLTYLGVGAFSDGYAPGALTHGTRLTVPWDQVREARAEGEQVFLAVEPRLTPHHRLVLTSFTSGDVVDPRELFRQRVVLRIGGVGAALVGMALIALTLPRISPETGGVTAVTLAAFAALGILGVALVADMRLGRGADEISSRLALVSELSIYVPHLTRSPHAPRKPPTPLTIPVIQGLMPRTAFAISATLASGILGAILMGRWIVAGGAEARYPTRAAHTTPVAPVDPQPRAAAAPHAPLSPPAAPAGTSSPVPSVAPPDPAQTGSDCRCGRADSALWAGAIPRVSTLLIGQRVIHRRNKNRLEVSIAAVNNGDKDLHDVTLRVHFLERDPPPSNKAYPVAQRAMYFEGPLRPGQAIKWTVEARGTAFELESPYNEMLEPNGADAAPTNLLAELLHANHRPVRLHGAMMLAYLNDPRARQAVLDLREALREDEAPYLRRLVQATSDVRVCNLHVEGGGATRRVSACVFNTSREARANVGIQVRALEHPVSHLTPIALPPTMLADAKWKVTESLAPSSGVQTQGTLDLADGGLSADAFEAHADRFDLLD
jgi:hypothetical protein